MARRPGSNGIAVACAIGVVLSVALVATNSAAQDPEAAGDPHDERALEVARSMAEALAGSESLRVTIEMAYDAVQPDGQAIEFGAIRHISLRRPDRARVEAIDRDGSRRLLVYDGRGITLFDASQGVYATLEHQGDLEGMLDRMARDFGVPTPLGEFLSRDLFGQLAGSDSVQWVDAQSLDGVICDHLAFRNAETGLQVWVPQEGPPLPKRVVITYEQAVGRPQFRADLEGWQQNVGLDDSLFTFAPGPDAEQIRFNAGGQLLPGAGTPKREEVSP